VNDYAVVGGTGTVGRLIASELRAAGGAVRALSRHSADHPVDLTTGRGLSEALSGCSVVIDASNGSSRRPEPVIVEGSRRLIEAALEVGVSRLICVSIVGIEKVPTRYYRAKLAQEQIVQDSGLPSTIVRSTQFHELLAAVFAALARFRLSPRSGARLQPVAAAEAARFIADVARHPGPPERMAVAGPEVADISRLAGLWQERGRRRLLRVPMPLVPRLGRPLRDGALTCAHPDFHGEASFESWLSAGLRVP
jgi:uncharacterized protein YbjT (DUF2867 family)